ncbi:MAG: trypsin-like peptidase domain-containing protein [Armatimonadota bacterium]
MAVAAAPVAAALPRPSADLAAVVVGIVSDGQVIAGGMTLASGPWGTDYITVSHALGVGRKYAVVHGDGVRVPATPVMACSSAAHGMDILVLRVLSLKNSPVMEWGDPGTLRAGDELVVMVRKEFHPEPVRVKFVHQNLLAWLPTGAGPWGQAWHNVMVAHGMAQPGFSGSPWVRDGKVYGLFKGRVKPPGQGAWYATAETSTRVKQCLNVQSYELLIPNDLDEDLSPRS